MDRFERMIHAQNGSLVTTGPIGKSNDYLAKSDGYLYSFDGQLLGQAIIAMGGGRIVAGQAIDFSVGLQMHCKVGAKLVADQPILTVQCDDENKSQLAMNLIDQAIVISDEQPTPPPLWRDFVTT